MKNSTYKYIITHDGAKIRTGFWPSVLEQQKESFRNVILLQGRASFIEKFHEIIQGLTERGYNVWTFDWRGQGLSSRFLDNHHKGHVDSYDTYLNDLHQFMTEIVRPTADQIYIALAQSMGGHIILRYLQDFGSAFSGAMLISPMINIHTGAYPKPVAKAMAYLSTLVGLDRHYVIGHGDYNPILEQFEGNYLTGNPKRYQIHLELQNNNLPMVIGGITYGWLQATFQSIDISLKLEKLRNIQIPVFIIESEDDQIVDNSILPYVVQHIKQGIIKTYPHTRHQIFMESDEILNVFWHDLEAFSEHLMLLNTSIPPMKPLEKPQLQPQNATLNPAFINSLKSFIS